SRRPTRPAATACLSLTLFCTGWMALWPPPMRRSPTPPARHLRTTASRTRPSTSTWMTPGSLGTAATGTRTSAALIVAKCREHGINPDHIYPHQRFFATACPGTLPVAAIVVAVRAQLGQPIPVPPTPGKAVLDMFITYTKTQHWLIVGGHAHVIATSADEVAYRGGGVPVIPLSAVELAAYGIK